MPKFIEMATAVTLVDQLGDRDDGPVVLFNVLTAPPEDVDRLLAAWAADAGLMKRQPGFISTQLHRGIAGSNAFLNNAVWESVGQFRAAFTNPEFQARLSAYPDGVTVSPHLFRPVAMPGICVA
jgi:heme-degrading monooxygenase HmoA